ncbi:MAG: T9SS type A sorting domain-containing protein, partial [Bacteroidota bacterium]|nr:T9SS type A sorting domain-containing protein [Bacteroidota bacterium]
KRYMIDSYIESQDYKGAVALADEILNTKGIDQDLTCEMLYEKGIINKFYLKNNTDAYRSFSLLTSQYPKNVLAKMAKGQMSDLPKDSEKPYLTALSKEADGFKCSNYPNPFNPTTRFNFSIPKDGYTELRIYNSLGQEVKTLVSENLSKGQYSFEWNANNCASGIYYYTLKSGDQVSTYKMILMK